MPHGQSDFMKSTGSRDYLWKKKQGYLRHIGPFPNDKLRLRLFWQTKSGRTEIHNRRFINNETIQPESALIALNGALHD
jgi:hypothetical protein